MSKHTPGPWQVDETKALGAYGVWRNADECMLHICSVKTGETERPREERDANARLIAAAPDLLDACLTVRYRLFKGVSSEGTEDLQDILLAAIAKAEGTAP